MPVATIMDETFPSRQNLVSGFIATAVQKLESVPLDEDTVFGIKLCLHEAVVNAVTHGNQLNSDLSVHVVMKTGEQGIILEVTDQGDGFDFGVIPNPTTEENIGKYHGRGIYLIQHTMDSVEFLNGGRTIRMVKAVKQERVP